VDIERLSEVRTGDLGRLDADGRWLATAGDERLTGQPKFPRGTQYISSPLFARNMQRLSDYVKAAQSAER